MTTTPAEVKFTPEQLLEMLQFTPRTYKIQLWGYGGECVMGKVDRKIYDYFKKRRLDVEQYSWDYDYPSPRVPPELQPFPAGEWHDCDSIEHAYGADFDESSHITVEDENGQTVFESALGYNALEEHGIYTNGGDEYYIYNMEKGQVVFLGQNFEKGTFLDGAIDLKAPFNPEKLSFVVDDFDGWSLVRSVEYDGEIIENWGGGTNGKSSNFCFYVAGCDEKYKNEEDLEEEVTDWFPAKIKPVHIGRYKVLQEDDSTWPEYAMWDGKIWYDYSPDSNKHQGDIISIAKWQGLAQDPSE
jgi:hypothetical protein